MTRDERREVAARLRRLSGHREVDKEFVHEALGLYMGECVDGYDPVSVSKLADLIEPEERTCHMRDASWDAGQRTWGCICSECGAKHEHKRSRWMNFCPNCGAMVVDADA